jgi:hypothetical protein
MSQADQNSTTDNVTPLRAKAKDATGAQRAARFRKKRRGIVTVPARSSAGELLAPPALVAHPIPTPPPNAGRGIPAVTVAPRNGGAGVTAATLIAALALATVSGGFSITGMTAIFVGATAPVVGMGIALELGKLSAVAWLGHQRSSSSWALKVSLTMLVAVLMTLNAIGCFGYLSKAHIASALAGDLTVAGRTADTEARLSIQAGVVADLDRRLRQIDAAVDKATEKGRTTAAMKLAEDQRRNRSELAAERIREGKTLATLQVEKAAVDGERRKVEADLGPVRYLATLIGANDQDVVRWFILVISILLDPAAVLLLLAASRR